MQTQRTLLALSQVLDKLADLLYLLPAPGDPRVQVLGQALASFLAVASRADISLVQAVAAGDQVLEVGVGQGGADFDLDADGEETVHALQYLEGIIL